MHTFAIFVIKHCHVNLHFSRVSSIMSMHKCNNIVFFWYPYSCKCSALLGYISLSRMCICDASAGFICLSRTIIQIQTHRTIPLLNKLMTVLSTLPVRGQNLLFTLCDQVDLAYIDVILLHPLAIYFNTT